MSYAAETSILNLPDEILNKLFAYLPLEDKKHVRLSCGRFYQACNRFGIQRKEEMVFYGNIRTDKAIQLLSNSERKLWNIKMNGGHFENPRILKFFEKRGAQIASLTINNCEFYPTLVKRIVECCENLQSAEFVFSSTLEPKYYEIFFADFKALEKDGVVCQNVTSLTLDLPQSWELNLSLTNGKILAFFAVFPNVRNLALTIEIDEYFDDSSKICPVIPEGRLVFSCIEECVQKVSHQLEKLSLHFNYNVGKSYASIEMLNKIAAINMENLKELSLSSIDLWDGSVRNPFSKFKHLCHLDCLLGDEDNGSHSTFIQLLLSTATELRTLLVKTTSGFFMRKECFRALVKSRLETLTFHTTENIYEDYGDSVIGDFESFLLEESLAPNHTVRLLRVMSNFYLLFLFTKYFRGLRRLKIGEVAGDISRASPESLLILRNIFQMELRTLELHNCINLTHQNCSTVEFNLLLQWLVKYEQHFSPRPFDNLTCLHILEQTNLALCEFLLTNFAFPKLRSLFIETSVMSAGRNCNFKIIWQAVQKLTQLESLQIRWGSQTTFKQWVTLCGALPKLRHFIVTECNSQPFSKFEYVKLFGINPSLRSIHILKQNSVCGMFFKDLILNTVVVKMWASDYPIYHPIISEGIPHYYEKENYLRT